MPGHDSQRDVQDFCDRNLGIFDIGEGHTLKADGIEPSTEDGSVDIPRINHFSARTIRSGERDGNLFIPEYADDVSLETDRFTFLICPRDPTLGVRINISLNGDTASADDKVWCIKQIQAGRLVPAWYFPFTPTTTSGADVTTVSHAASNSRYKRLTEVTSFMEWTVPAAAAGCDKLIVYVFKVAGDGVADVLVNGTSIGTIDCGNTTSNRVANEFSLTTPLVSGDLIRIKYLSGQSDQRIHGIEAYDSDGTWSVGQHRKMTGTLTDFHIAGSGMECAYKMAAAGSATKFFMSFAHQVIASNGQQSDVVEAQTVNGSTVAIAQGYVIGAIVLTRTSVLRYANPGTDIGTAIEHYYLAGDQIRYDHMITLTAICDVDARYVAMFPAEDEFTYMVLDDRWVYDLSEAGFDDSVQHYFPAGTRMVRFGGLADLRACMLLNIPTQPVIRLGMETSAIRKMYWSIEENLDDVASGTRFGGGWTYWLESDGE